MVPLPAVALWAAAGTWLAMAWRVLKSAGGADSNPAAAEPFNWAEPEAEAEAAGVEFMPVDAPVFMLAELVAGFELTPLELLTLELLGLAVLGFVRLVGFGLLVVGFTTSLVKPLVWRRGMPLSLTVLPEFPGTPF